MDLSQKDREIIRVLSRTTYDFLVLPPPLDSLEHILKSRPKNYATIDIDDLTKYVLDNLVKSEPLINNFSKNNLNQLDGSIRISFHATNFMDLESGGKGLIIPTFMEIMHRYILWIREKSCSDLITKEDKIFYSKYFWCFQHYAQLTCNQMNKSA